MVEKSEVAKYACGTIDYFSSSTSISKLVSAPFPCKVEDMFDCPSPGTVCHQPSSSSRSGLGLSVKTFPLLCISAELHR
jgi:hypothetical protein